MGAGQGATADVFAAAASFAKRRSEKMKERAKNRRESAAQQVRQQPPYLGSEKVTTVYRGFQSWKI